MEPNVALRLCCSILLLVTFAFAATLKEKSQQIHFNPFVPLTHCMRLGEESNFKVEWSLNAPQRTPSK